jgi:hypothetical protein
MDCLKLEDDGDVCSLAGSPDEDEVDYEETGGDKPTDKKGCRADVIGELGRIVR